MGPEIVAGLSLVATAASGAFSAFSQYQAGQYQAAVARNNAMIAQQRADAARMQGIIEAQQQDLKGAAIMGQIEAQQGSSGIDISGRTATDVRSSAAMLNRLDALTKRNNAEREAYGFEIKKSDYLTDAKAKESAGLLNSVGSLIGGAGSVADKWSGFQSKGLLL